MTSYQRVSKAGRQASLAKAEGANRPDFIELPLTDSQDWFTSGQAGPVATEQGTT